jgi:hypothetical protein
MKNYIKKIVFIASFVSISISLFFIFPDSIIGQGIKDSIGLKNTNTKVSKSIELFNKMKSYSDSNVVIKYNYSMRYDVNDTSNEQFNGVVYKTKGLNIDSNAVQYTFNTNQVFFSINHKAQLAVYSNLTELKEEIKKNSTTEKKEDSLKILSKKMNSIDFSDTVLSFLIQNDRSFENDSKIVIDVDFIDESPLLNYYLVFDKTNKITDSMRVQFTEISDVQANESELEEEDLTYYNDLISNEILVTFTANKFQKGNFATDNKINAFVSVSGKQVKLKGFKNYNLTILK